MTTASADHVEKSRKSKDPQRRGGRTGSDPSYLVLIRLPMLDLDEAPEAATIPAEPQETYLPNPAAIAVAGVVAPTAETADASGAVPGGEQTKPAESAPRFGSGMTWSRFQGVRLLGQMFVGLLLIGLCVAAYLMIVGGHDTPSTAKSPETPAADRQTPNDSDPATPAQDAAETQSRPAADAKTVSPLTASPASVPADREAAAGSSASSDRQGREETSPPAATVAPSKPLLENGLTTDPVQPSLGPGGQDSRVQADARPAAESAAWGGSRPSSPDSQLPLIEQPGTASSAGPANPTDPSSSPYPVTDPSKFQYPAQYHEILRSRANAGPTTDSATGPVGRSATAYQPSTARLQPPMNPPPIR